MAVCIHWGNEYERKPNKTQRTIARNLRQAGADLIIGSHPHVVQPYEADSTHAVFYSLGNFVSNQRKRYCDGGLMAEITLTLHPDLSHRRSRTSRIVRKDLLIIGIALSYRNREIRPYS